MKKHIALFCALLIVVASLCTACGKEKVPEGNNHFVQVTESENTFVSDGKTSYRIVIPENATSEIKFAASEITYFVDKTTGAKIKTVVDAQLGTSSSQKLLSVGNTKQAQAAGISAPESEFGTEGYVVKTVGNTMFFLGGGDKGSLFSVYEFVERVLGAKVYAKDEIVLPHKDAITLPNMDIREIPDIARRAPGLNDIAIDKTLRYRLRTQMYNDGWIYWSHSYFRIIPPDVYMEKHRDWFSPDEKQLCISNDEMCEEFIKNVIALAEKDVKSEYIMLGQQDGANMCRCSRCSAEAEKYNYSGLMMHFVNKVAKAVGEWISINQPGRKLLLGTFAYEDTEKAPVKYDEKKDTYTPIDDTVLPEPNVALMFAPGRACYAHSFDAECNASVMSTIKGWNAIFSTNILAWIYNAQFGYYLLPFPNWSSTAADYKILKESGFNFIYHQGTRETTTGALSEMRLYVQSKLMWNTELDSETLAEEFIDAYYKDAAPMIKTYYNLYRQNFALKESEGNWHAYCMTANANLFMQESVYPKGMLDRMEELFEEAKVAASVHKDTDKALYETLSMRVRKEQLTVRFLYLTLYPQYFTKAQISDMIDDFETVCNLSGITQWAELGSGYEYKTIVNLLADWRRTLL